jgi:23S rRNA (uracil1939-C5)-methyltransferase
VARELKLQPVLEADIVDLAHDGRGVARVDGKAVFIGGALPGERVRYRLIKRRRQMDEAALEEVLIPSPDRVDPKCAHFGVCGGCSLQHLAPPAQLAAKERQLLDNLQRIGRVRPQRVLAPVQGPHWAYRRRARLGVKYVHKKGRVLAGFREREKPYIADIRQCEILSGGFATLPQQLAALVETLTIREKLPQVEVAVGDGRAALVFRVLEAPSPEDLQRIAAFGTELGVQIYLQSGGLDTIRPLRPGTEAPRLGAGAQQPEAAALQSGAERQDAAPLQYAVDGGEVVIEFGPVDFIQVNREVNISMVAAAMELLQPAASDSVLDLFCGLGNFTLPLGRRAARVVGVEGDAALVAKASANAVRNGIGNATFFKENLFEPASLGAWTAERYDLVLLDPPRAGACEILERMAHWRPRRVVYISCHPGSLARDAGILVQGQGFELIGAGVMDMFPHTTHVESIAVFENRT